MATQLTAASAQVEIDGQPLPPEVEIIQLVVEDSLHHPDAFAIELRDIDRGLVGRAKLKIGAKVKIGVIGDTFPSATTLIEGEVTALEAEVDGATNVTIVRGYDESHRLFRGRTSASYQNLTASDVAGRVAKRLGLKAGTIDPTSPVMEHVGQEDQNDWEFLSALAGKVGYEVAVSGGKLHFRKPQAARAGPGRANLTSEDPLQLLLGSTLIRIRAGVSSAGQVREVQARGWDPLAKSPVVANAKPETVMAEIGTTPAKVAEPFSPPPLVAAKVPLSTNTDVESFAKAVAEDLGSSFAELEGVARGNPKLRAGTAVAVGLVGEPFDGKYVLTSCRHVFDRFEGYTTAFTVSGRHDRTMLALTDSDTSARIDGVVIALVDDVDDKEGQCRVRLRFPWLSEDYVSDWARTVQLGAGADRGMIVLPEVGDEVLVAFDRGDLHRPFVIGGLYNGKDKPKLGAFQLLDSGKHTVDTRRFVSRAGHAVTLSDAQGKEKILVESSDGKLTVELDVGSSTIKITSGGKVQISADSDASIEAKGNLTIKGAQVAIEAQSSLDVKGAQVAIDAQATLDAKASGTVSVKGALIQLN